ncbi:S41 family peptidase [Paraflavitalea pollutisoli]|uniref:S41 family peptidase n=1 Tax=Paraflavitalea pollutisoli TaxID=3034143 RepID=UPI0023EC65EA|nr:S41 family peptidase [Paraflavitalea sp. H1-2-19X]
MVRLLTTLFVLGITSVVAQTGGAGAGTAQVQPDTSINHQEVDRLYLLGKVWGLLKYHHPAITRDKYDWDKELIGFLPGYRPTGKRSSHDSLLAWVNRLGPIEACDTCMDHRPGNVALQGEVSWIGRSGFPKALRQQLIAIRQQRVRGNQHYVRFITEDDIHVAAFDHENAYGSMSYPSVAYRLLALFRYWNIIEYYYPYKYDLGQSWDTVLKQFIPQFVAARNANEYAAVVRQLIATIHDSHAVVQARIITEEQGSYVMPIWLKFIEGKAVVIDRTLDSLASLSGIRRGDIIDSIDGVSVTQLVARNRPLISASNDASYLNLLRYSLIRSRQDRSVLVVERGGTQLSLTTYNQYTRTSPNMRPGTFEYERDSVLCRINDSIGYVNLGNFQRKDSTRLRALVSSVHSLIIDNRQYPKAMSAGDLIAACIFSRAAAPFVKFSSPDPDCPGRFLYSKPTNMGAAGTEVRVPGKIAILVNEETQSSTEFQAMLFRKAQGAVLIGTPTAGADGNVALINLPGNIYTYISGLGVYYPDGRETQRVGLQPDIVVRTSIQALRDNRDELLERAVRYVGGD